MDKTTYKQLIEYITKNPKGVSPHELSRVTGKSRVSVHLALKKLVMNGDIEKHGLAPRVYYSPLGEGKRVTANSLTLEDIRNKIEPVMKKYPIIYAGVFGSVARGEAGPKSDVDIMISYHRPFSMITMIGLEHDLTEALGIKVDLLTDRGANKYIKANMMRDLKVVYGKR